MHRRAFVRNAAVAALGAKSAIMVNRSEGRASSPVQTIAGNVTSNIPWIVAAGTTLRFDPDKSTTLTMNAANLVVLGTLEMRPARPDVVHTIRFSNVLEPAFVGGGMDVLPTDVGLWVMDSGVLDIQGAPKSAWNRVGSDPSWSSADELVVAPSVFGDTTGFKSYRMGDPLPVVADRWKPEVLNLTRNVRIEGTATGRTHVFIRSARPQSIRYASLRFVGPRKNGSFVPGRYGLHFHMCMDGARGSIVEGVIVRDAGSHSYVPHHTNGVTFRDSIAYNVLEDAFWWDPSHGSGEHETSDITYDRCVAALVKTDKAQRGYLLAGFRLEEGHNNVCRACVAVGVQGRGTASGFHWPEGARNGLWVFEDCLAHNNAVNGIYVWQNDGDNHDVVRFDAYHNVNAAVHHGAYVNVYNYLDGHWYRNGSTATAALKLSAVDKEGRQLAFKRVTIDQAGATPALVSGYHVGTAEQPTLFEDCRFTTTGPVAVLDDRGSPATRWDFVRCVASGGRDLVPADFKRVGMGPGGLIRVQRLDRSAWQMDWSGRVTEVSGFA